MHIQNTLEKTDENGAVAVAEPRTSEIRQASERSDPAGRPRGRRRWLAALAATVAFGGIVNVAVGDRGGDSTPSGGAGTGQVSDDSFGRAEANRMATLRELWRGRVPDDSFDVAEANRMATLRDLGREPVPDDSYETAEANRMATLHELWRGRMPADSFDRAEANRMATLRDL